MTTSPLRSSSRTHIHHRHLTRQSLAASLAVVASLAAPQLAQAQVSPPTTTNLGTYTVCSTSSSAQACHEVSLTTAPRLGGNGARNGTVGTISLRNLQGSTFVAPNGTSFLTGTGASMLTGITLFTQGCLPGGACVSPFFFDGLDFGTSENGTAAAAASGPVGGNVPGWRWTAEKPLAANNPNILRFDANLVFQGPGSGNQMQGIGGCTRSGGQVAGQFYTIVPAATTCAGQGQSGAVQFSFATGFIFDPTYFGSMRVDWVQQGVPGQGDYVRNFCGISANTLGQALTQATGNCASIGSVTAVPEPATWASLSAGLLALLAMAKLRGTHTWLQRTRR